MAERSTTERTVRTKFDGDARGGIRAARAMERELKRLQKETEARQASFISSVDRGASRAMSSISTVTKGVLGLGSAVGTVQGAATAVVGTVSAVSSLSGVLLAAPGIALAAGAAYGVLGLAVSGFTEALKAEDPKAFAEATKNMAPDAIRAAQAIREQRDRLAELRRTVQGRFFAGFEDDVRALADRYFPILNDQTGSIAGRFAAMRRNASKALLAPSSVAAVNSILGSTNDTLRELEPSLGNVLRGVLSLGGVGAKRAVLLGRAINDLTADFDRWVASGVESGRINEIIDEGIDTAKDFGRVLQNVGGIGRTVFGGLSAGGGDFLESMEKSTQAIEDFLKSAEGQAILRELGQTLNVTADVARDVFSTAMRELGPVVREVAPAAREMAVAVGELLVNALEIVGPMLQSTARFLSENKDVVRDLVPIIIGLALAYKGLKVATEVRGWLSGLPSLFDDTAKKATKAGDAIGDAKTGKGFAGRLGALKAIGVVAAVAVVGSALSTVGSDAEQAAGQLNAAEIALRGVGKGLNDLAALDLSAAMQNAKDARTGILLELARLQAGLVSGKHLRIEMSIGADTKEAEIKTKFLIGAINKSSGTVNINGNDNPAAFALRRVLQEIAQGKETVTIDGQSVPAQDALRGIIDQINRESGTVRINGNDVPAGQALAELLRRTDASTASIKVNANTSGAQGVIDSFITMNNGKTIQIYTSVLGSGGLASAGRLATGGAVYGRGTGTSDTAGLFALSRGEHVLTAAEVRMLGGQGAVYRMRQIIRAGGLTGLATGGAAVPATFARSVPLRGGVAPNINVSAGPAPEVRVFIGEREITEVVRVVVNQARKQERRVAATGPGGAL